MLATTPKANSYSRKFSSSVPKARFANHFLKKIQFIHQVVFQRNRLLLLFYHTYWLVETVPSQVSTVSLSETDNKGFLIDLTGIGSGVVICIYMCHHVGSQERRFKPFNPFFFFGLGSYTSDLYQISF